MPKLCKLSVLTILTIKTANSAFTELPECTASQYNPKTRVDCGRPGTSRSECETLGCCWDDRLDNVAWCFRKMELLVSTQEDENIIDDLQLQSELESQNSNLNQDYLRSIQGLEQESAMAVHPTEVPFAAMIPENKNQDELVNKLEGQKCISNRLSGFFNQIGLDKLSKTNECIGRGNGVMGTNRPGTGWSQQKIDGKKEINKKSLDAILEKEIDAQNQAAENEASAGEAGVNKMSAFDKAAFKRYLCHNYLTAIEDPEKIKETEEKMKCQGVNWQTVPTVEEMMGKKIEDGSLVKDTETDGKTRKMLCAMMLKMVKNETLQAEKSTQTKCDGVDWKNAGDMKGFMQSLISGQVSPKAKTASLNGLAGLTGAAGLGAAGGAGTQQQMMMCNLMKQRYANRYVSERTRQLMAMQGCQLPQGLGMGMGGGMYGGMSNDIPSRLFKGNPQGQMMLGVHSFRSKIGDKFGWNTQDDLAYHVSLLQRKYLDMSIVPWDIMEVCIAQIRTHNDMDNGRRDCYRQWPGNIKTDDDCMKHGCVPFKNFCTRCPVIDPYLREAADAEHSMRSGGFSVTLDRCAVETTKREYCIGFSSSTDNSRTNMMGMMMQQGGGGYNPMMSQMFNKKDLKDRCAALNCCFDEKAYQQKTMGGAYFQHLAGPFCYRERIIQQAKAWETEDVCLPQEPVSGETSDLMKTRCGIGADPNFDEIQLSSRIIGMDASLKAKVTETSRPWMVKVLPPKSDPVSGTLGTENINLKCSGVIICQKWVVTTASCLFTIQTEEGELMPNIKPQSLRIFYKNSHVNQFVDDADLTPAPVFSIKNHPLFRVGSFSHDIALMRTSLTVGTEVNGVGYDALPICLPPANVYQSHGTSAFMAGYGVSETRTDFALRGIGSIFEEVRSGQLLEIKNEIVANSICEAEYGGVYSSTGTLCLKVHSSEAADVKKESCYGDGGGPVAVYDEDKKVWTLVGLIAGGSLDCDGRKPTIVTDIATYRPWIMEETKGCCNSRKMIVARG